MSVINFPSSPDGIDEVSFSVRLPSKTKPTTGVAENYDAAFKAAQAQQPLAPRWYEQTYFDNVIEEIEAQSGVRLEHPAPWYQPIGSDAYERNLYNIQKYVRDNLDDLQGDFSLLLDPDFKTKIREQAAEKAKADIAEGDEIYSRAEGFMPTAASYAGMFAAEAVDPVNIALALGTSPVALGAKTFGGIMLREALLNASAEAIYQPAVANWYKELGYDYDFKDFRNAVLTAGAVGGGFAGVIKIGGDTIRLTNTQLKNGYRALVGSGAAKETDVGKGAEMAFDAEAGVAADNPLTGVSGKYEHTERAVAAQRAVIENTAPKMADLPDAPTKAPESVHEQDNLNGEVFAFDPDDIQVDAATFQFKAGGDEYGVTDRLRDVTVWDSKKSGQILVYEYADTSMFIADGHQRLGLAKRIKSQDPSQNVKLYGYKLRETDGITPEEAMVTAAFKNITEGTGSVIDAAKVFRFSPEKIDDPSFPKGSEFVKQARGLSNLSNDAFGMVINEVVEPQYGAIVGRLLGGDEEMQTAAMSVLAKTQPSTQFQAEAITRQVIEAGVTRETQESLFGDEIITESLYLERAKVLERAKNQLKKDKAAFQNLVRNADRIEGEGNQLARDVNEQRTLEDGKAIALLTSQANKKGALSDALTDAARLAKEQGSYTSATTGFLNAVRRAINEGDFERAEISDVGRIIDDTAEAPSLRNEQEQNSLDMFDEPLSDGAAQQASAVTEGIRADVEAPELLREDLRRLVESGADEDAILSHPAIERAVNEMEAIPTTDTRPNFNTDAWYDNRQYVIGARQDASIDEVLEYLVDGSRKLGWVDDKLDYPANALRQERKAVIILGPPAAGKSTIANPIARNMGAAIVDADEAKKVLPEYNGGIGANAVHEESSILNDLTFEVQMSQGDNLVIPKVGGSPDSIRRTIQRLKEQGYEVDLVDMVVDADEALRRMIARFIATGRLINPDYVKKVGNNPSNTYNILREEGVADGYTRIDNQGAKDAPKPVLEDTRNLLENVDIRLGRGADEGRVEGAGSRSAASIAEVSERAESVSIPKVEESLLDAEFPVEEMVDADGDVVARTVTARQLLSEIDQDDAMIDRLSRCPL